MRKTGKSGINNNNHENNDQIKQNSDINVNKKPNLVW